MVSGLFMATIKDMIRVAIRVTVKGCYNGYDKGCFQGYYRRLL